MRDISGRNMFVIKLPGLFYLVGHFQKTMFKFSVGLSVVSVNSKYQLSELGRVARDFMH